ncbi:MAG: hypothetical protein ABJA87_13750 [bacterium]
MPPDDLGTSNQLIDAAAERVGRSPRDIRRTLNVGGTFSSAGGGLLQGSAAQWGDELTDMALMYGTSTFIVAGDDPDDPRRFANEVAPAVRAAVAAERESDETSDQPVASASENGAGAMDRRDGAEATPVRQRTATSSLGAAQIPLSVGPTPDDGRRRSAVRVWDESTRPTGSAREPGRRYTAAEPAGGRQVVEVHNMLRAELSQIYDLVEQVAARTVTAVTARSAPVLDRLEIEHEVIYDVPERVDQALVQFESVPDAMPALKGSAGPAERHAPVALFYEERELVEPLARLGIV